MRLLVLGFKYIIQGSQQTERTKFKDFQGPKIAVFKNKKY